MLKPPHQRYDHLWVYNFNTTDIGPIDDPDHIGTWIEDDTAILFFHHDKKELIESIRREKKAEIIYQADLDYRDWEAGLDVTSFTVGPLRVCPVWEKREIPGQQELIDILLDPSVIFGSGFHPSTLLCLRSLVKLYREMNVQLDSVIDFGTGTGILAISSALLGAKKTIGYDYNPLACSVAKKNIGLNNCQKMVSIEQIDLLKRLPSMQSDLVICNLYKGLLLHLFNNPEFWNASYYLVSGFIPGMEEDLLSALPMDDLKLVERCSEGPWRLWLLEHK